MNKGEAVSGAVFVVIGALMLYQALKFAYLVDGVPGPGFLPRWIAVGLIGTGTVLAWKALRPMSATQERAAWPDAGGWRRVALMLGALAACFIVLKSVGFLVTTALFVAVVIYGLGVRSWKMLASVPLLAAIVLYVVFAVWLSVPLPKGVLEVFERI